MSSIQYRLTSFLFKHTVRPMMAKASVDPEKFMADQLKSQQKKKLPLESLHKKYDFEERQAGDMPYYAIHSRKSVGKKVVFYFFGGVLFMIGDCLLYVYPGRGINTDIDPAFAAMPVWRFTISALLGFFGMALMLFGFQSLYAMTKQICGKKLQYLMLAGGVGVAGTALGHFTLGSLIPLTYKSVLSAGGTAEMAEKACLV